MKFTFAAMVGWLKSYFCSIAAFFISGLVVGHAFVDLAVVGAFISYLRSYWNQALPLAAGFTNFQDGLSTVLVIVVAFISDAYLGRFKTVICSACVYLLGLVMLCIAAWIQSNDISILCVAMLLIALGRAGRKVPLKAFLADQFLSNKLTPEETEEHKKSRQNLWWGIFWSLGTVLALLIASVSYNLRCLISTIAMSVAFLCFLSGYAFTSYNCILPTGSSLGNVLRVIKVAILNRDLSYALSSTELNGNDSDEIQISPAVPILRWLDKAAKLRPEQQEKEARICTVAEVKQVKLLFTIVPMWITFLIYSLVDSLGRTFYIEQADIMNANFIIIQFFLIIRSFIYITMSYFCGRIKCNARMMIGVGMFWSICSCILAAIVEHQRTGESSVFILTPQFICLGLMDGFAINGLNEFFDAHVSESMRIYGPNFTDCVLGIGKFVSIIFILICLGWFGENADSSHLDRYYGMVAILSILNLIGYAFVAYKYGGIMVKSEETDLEEIITDRSYLLFSQYWRTGCQYWSNWSPRESARLRRLITLTGSGTELNDHVISIKDENSCQQRTRCPERWFHSCQKMLRRSFTALGFGANQSQEMTRRQYRFAPNSSLEASILMSKGWGPGVNYPPLSRPNPKEEVGEHKNLIKNSSFLR